MISDVIKYLGVHLGPGAQAVQWDSAIAKMTLATGRVIRLGLGLAGSIPVYNALAHSCGAWLASIVKLSPSAHRTECKNIQKLTRGPWFGIPTDLVFHVKARCGFKAEARSLQIASLAGQNSSSNRYQIPGECRAASCSKKFG